MSTLTSYGADPTGTADSRNALIAFVAANEETIEEGTFRISQNVAITNKSNLTITGAGNSLTKIISDTVRVFSISGITANLEFVDLWFSSAFDSLLSGTTDGLLFINDQQVTGLIFRRCRFSSPLTNSNGVKFIFQTVF